MSIVTDIQSLSPSAVIEMFVLNTSDKVGGDVFRFHSNVGVTGLDLVWGGNTYTALPIEAEGFDLTARGSLPRPKLRVSNANGVFSAQVMAFDDLVGSTITRQRTLAKYLDAVNFPGGVNATADPNQHYPEDLWYIEQKTMENHYQIEWELSSVFDLMGVKLPGRQVVKNSCPWRYRTWNGSAWVLPVPYECGYTGTIYLTATGKTTLPNGDPCTQATDVCGKSLASCKGRWGDQPLPFGGFPGSVAYG